MAWRAFWAGGLTAASLLLSGCEPELGTCDSAAGMSLVYADDAEGIPMYPGQSLVYRTCGGSGNHCHSALAPIPNRNGVPHGLDFDVALATAGESETMEEVREKHDRLQAGLAKIYEWRHWILDTVQEGTMPPGDAGRATFDATNFVDTAGNPVASPFEDDGVEVLRNWLACGSPIVERTDARPMGFPALGTANVAGNPIELDPTWPSIYDGLISRRCATPACHSMGTEAGALVLDDPHVAWMNLVGVMPAGTRCDEVSTPRVDPCNADGSLLVHKLVGDDGSGDVCGDIMPNGRTTGFPEDVMAPIREWIATGACEDPADPMTCPTTCPAM